MTVLVPPPLHSYTGGKDRVEAAGSSLAECLADLDASFPGIRFRMIDEQDRIRPHIRLFVNAEPALSLDRPLAGSDRVQIVCALSGG